MQIYRVLTLFEILYSYINLFNINWTDLLIYYHTFLTDAFDKKCNFNLNVSADCIFAHII